MSSKVLLSFLLLFLLANGLLAQNGDPYQIIARQCSSCHRWTLEKEAVDTLKTTMAKRLMTGDGHIEGKLNKRETEVVGLFVGLKRNKPKPVHIPVIKPVQKKDDEAKVFSVLASACGKCHGWAKDKKVVRKLKKRLAPRVRMGHGTRSLSKEKRKLLEAYYLTPPSSAR